MEQKLSDTLVKAIDRSNPMMQNLQLASRFNKLIDESGADLEDNHEAEITENGEIEITPAEGKDGMKKVTATVNVAGGSGLVTPWCYRLNTYDSDRICIFDKSATISVRIGDDTYHNIVDTYNSIVRQGDLLVVSPFSDCYTPMELSEGDNPSQMGLYEYTERQGYPEMTQTSDTTVNPSKTYYDICYPTETSVIVVEQDGDTYEMINNKYQWTEGQLSPVQS